MESLGFALWTPDDVMALLYCCRCCCCLLAHTPNSLPARLTWLVTERVGLVSATAIWLAILQ